MISAAAIPFTMADQVVPHTADTACGDSALDQRLTCENTWMETGEFSCYDGNGVTEILCEATTMIVSGPMANILQQVFSFGVIVGNECP